MDHDLPIPEVPRGACDCHAHVYGPPDRYPLRAGARYTPQPRYLADYQAMLARLGIDHAVIVQPTVYDSNAVTADAIAASKGAWRGVAKFAGGAQVSDVGKLDEAGFRGVRMHGVGATGENELDRMEEVARLIAPYDWHMQIHMDSALLPELESRIAKLPVTIVFDHFAKLKPEDGLDTAPMGALLRLLETGRVWVKLSGAYIVSKEPYPHPLLKPVAEKLVAERADRMVWATDWPHPSHQGLALDDTIFLKLLNWWVPDTATRNRILTSNPKQLYKL